MHDLQQRPTSTAIVSLRFLMVDLLSANFSTAAANSSTSIRPGARAMQGSSGKTSSTCKTSNAACTQTRTFILTVPIAVKKDELLLKSRHLPCFSRRKRVRFTSARAANPVCIKQRDQFTRDVGNVPAIAIARQD
jgi:hypothetical protein